MSRATLRAELTVRVLPPLRSASSSSDSLTCIAIRYYLGGEDYWDHTRSGGLDWHRNDTLETAENGTYSADLLGIAAAQFITKMSTRGTPWYLYLPFQSVHSPLEAEDKDLALYPELSGSVKTRAAMITALDRAVGNVTHALTQTEQLDDVILIFTSDNGAPYGAAFDTGDDPAMMDALGMQTREGPHYNAGPVPERPPSGGNGTHTHGGGGGSNYPFSGWKHYVFGAMRVHSPRSSLSGVLFFDWMLLPQREAYARAASSTPRSSSTQVSSIIQSAVSPSWSD